MVTAKSNFNNLIIVQLNFNFIIDKWQTTSHIQTTIKVPSPLTKAKKTSMKPLMKTPKRIKTNPNLLSPINARAFKLLSKH